MHSDTESSEAALVMVDRVETSVFKVMLTPTTGFARGASLPLYLLRSKQRAMTAAVPKSTDRISTSHQFLTNFA